VRSTDHFYSGVLWMCGCSECCVLSGSSLCHGLITCTEKSYGRLFVWIVV